VWSPGIYSFDGHLRFPNFTCLHSCLASLLSLTLPCFCQCGSWCNNVHISKERSSPWVLRPICYSMDSLRLWRCRRLYIGWDDHWVLSSKICFLDYGLHGHWCWHQWMVPYKRMRVDRKLTTTSRGWRRVALGGRVRGRKILGKSKIEPSSYWTSSHHARDLHDFEFLHFEWPNLT